MPIIALFVINDLFFFKWEVFFCFFGELLPIPVFL